MYSDVQIIIFRTHLSCQNLNVMYSSSPLHCSPSSPAIENLGECSPLNLTALTRKLEQIEQVQHVRPRSHSYNTQIVSGHDEYCVRNEYSPVASVFPNSGSAYLSPTWSNREIKTVSNLALHNLFHISSRLPLNECPARLQVGDRTVFPSRYGPPTRLLFREESSSQLTSRYEGAPAIRVFPDPADLPVLSRHDKAQKLLLFHESSRQKSLLYHPDIPLEETRMRRIINPNRKLFCPVPYCTAAIEPYIEDVREHLVCDHSHIYSLPSKSSTGYLRCSCGRLIWGGGEAIALHIASVHVDSSRKATCVHCDWEGKQGTFFSHLIICPALYVKKMKRNA
ncbi:hypothetical protein F5051DRAFT_395868 [Lentinula edodes]|nr:hypothetical protein F5051DRAFT_395868 [Lentinula edodes]